MQTWRRDFFLGNAKLAFDEGDYNRTRNSCAQVLARDPDVADCWRMMGEAALACRDSSTALSSFERLVELEPENADAFVQLGKACIQLKAYETCAQSWRQALLLDPHHREAEQLLGMIERLREAMSTLGPTAPAVVGRNDPCPCGSGQKYKRCCLRNATHLALDSAMHEAMTAGDWVHAVSIGEALLRESPELVAVRRATGLAHARLEHWHEAAAMLQPVVARAPDDAEAVLAMGRCLLELGELAGAEPLLSRGLSLDPGNREARVAQAWIALRKGLHAEAQATFVGVLATRSDDLWAFEGMGESCRAQGDLTGMLAWYERAVHSNPQAAKAWYLLGNARLAIKRPKAEARTCFEQAIGLKPDYSEAWNNLGCLATEDCELDRAETCFLHALRIRSDYAMAWNNLGNVYKNLGRTADAEGCLKRAIAANPQYVEAWNNLGNIYLAMRRPEEAEACLQEAVTRRNDSAIFWNNLGNAYLNQGLPSKARDIYRKALELDPKLAEAHNNLGNTEVCFGNFDEAISHYHYVIDHYNLARSNLLFAINYHADWTAERIFDEYTGVLQRYYPERLYAEFLGVLEPERRLRIGYVSPDFRMHACRYFVDPLLAHHDHANYEIYAYADVANPDYVTEEMRGYVDVWRHSVGMSDKQLAEQIHADGIDILVDLAGHTEGNRLAMFALKPAPIQVSWLGFGYTTGLKAMDYFLTDEETVPVGYEHLFAETPWRMALPEFAYRANETMPEVGPLPALRNGYVTFGTLSRSLRINHRVLKAWAEILHGVPGSRLMLNSSNFIDPGIQEHIAAQLDALGIPRERLDMGCTSPPWPALAAMDIALDCFPHNSGTTLFEGLWQGVPFVTLRARPSMGRLGATILRGLGRPEWIADTEEEYVAKAVALASDVGALVAIREGLRELMRASPLCDGAGFAQKVEGAYRGMWRKRCGEVVKA